MNPDHLLQIATELAEVNIRRPRRADLCRAVSTAYYALFHCLARTCADGLAGSSGSGSNRPMWRQVYRALDHGQAKKRCENVPPFFQEEVRDFGQTFADLQSKRHSADYDPDHPVKKSGVIKDIESARTAIDLLVNVPPNVQRNFAIHVLMKVRDTGRSGDGGDGRRRG